MRYSDRTISYDTGLNLMQPVQKLTDNEDELGIVILPPSGGVSEKRRRARKTGKEHSFPVIFASTQYNTQLKHSGKMCQKLTHKVENVDRRNHVNKQTKV